MKPFFKPDWRQLTVFAVLFLVAYAGSIQGWVFSGKDAGLAKPFLYDLIAPIPFWSLWMYLLTPLFILTGGLINQAPAWLFWIINLIYFYLISCLAIFAVGSVRKHFLP